jgi:hypothetical protein
MLTNAQQLLAIKDKQFWIAENYLAGETNEDSN